MRTITLTVNNRPDYLRQMLDSLKKNNLNGYTLYCSVEPENLEVWKTCLSIDFVPTVIIRNSEKRGVRDNPFKILSTVFDNNSNFNIYLEDDIILSPDAFDLANWYFEHPDSNCLCCLFFNYGSNPSSPETIRKVRDFNALGLALTKDSWLTKFRPAWYKDARGWDWSIIFNLFSQQDWFCYQPIAGRSNHIGRNNGTHAAADFHDQTFSGIKINDKKCMDFKIQ